MKELSGLTQLRTLNLNQTRVAELKGLAGLKQLRALDLSGNDVNEGDIAVNNPSAGTRVTLKSMSY